MPNVTVLGVSGAVVTVPFTSTANAAAAQAAANVVSSLVTGGVLTQYNLPSGATSAPTSSTAYGGAVESVGGTGSIVTLPQNYLALTDNTSSPASFVSSPYTVGQTVIAGGSALNMFNEGVNTSAFFGSGTNTFTELTTFATATVNVDGVAFIGGTLGSTTVNAFYNSVVNVTGNVTVNAANLSATVFVSGGSTVPAVINAQSYGLQVENIGGNAIINPGSANVTVFGSSSGGSSTVFGANSLTGGTSSLTVTGAVGTTGASGYYVGGSGGGNLLFGSTVTGATTLVGGSGTDTMFSSGANDVVRSTSGKDLIAAFASGDTLIAGTGTDTIFGSNTGGNTFIFNGAGTSTVYGSYGIKGTAATTYIDSVGGGTITINDFRSGTDLFRVLDGASISSYQTNLSAAVPNTVVKLSDGTTVTFNYAAPSGGDFKFG